MPKVFSIIVTYNHDIVELKEFICRLKSQTDFVVICDVGAYGMSLSSNYNLRPKPTELLIERSKIKVINKRQSLKDLI